MQHVEQVHRPGRRCRLRRRRPRQGDLVGAEMGDLDAAAQQSARRHGESEIAQDEEFARRIGKAQLVEAHVEGNHPVDRADPRRPALAGERRRGPGGEIIPGRAGLRRAEDDDEDRGEADGEPGEDLGDAAQRCHGQNACPRLT